MSGTGVLSRDELTSYLNALLEIGEFSDHAPNGLQVEGRDGVRRIAMGVSANQMFLDEAVAKGADAVIVHHGLFWRKEPTTLTHHRARRIRTILDSRVSLYAYHHPLDAHPTLGNNACLLKAIGAASSNGFGGIPPIGRTGSITEQAAGEVRQLVEAACGQAGLAFFHGQSRCQTVAVMTGAGAGYFEEAVMAGADLFVTGEPSEQSQALARELNANFIAVGHHATERFGPQALGAHLAETLGLEVEFVDVANPV